MSFESQYATFILVINSNLGLSLTVFEIWPVFRWISYPFNQPTFWKCSPCTRSL